MTKCSDNISGRSSLGSGSKRRSDGVNVRLAVPTAWPGRWAIDAPDSYVLADDSQARSSHTFKRSVLRRQPAFRQGISRTMRHSFVRCDHLQRYPGIVPGDIAPSFSTVTSWPSDPDGERFRRSFPRTVEPDAPSLPGSSQLFVMQWNSAKRAVPGCLAPPQRSQGRSSPRPKPTPAPRKSGPRTRSLKLDGEVRSRIATQVPRCRIIVCPCGSGQPARGLEGDLCDGLLRYSGVHQQPFDRTARAWPASAMFPPWEDHRRCGRPDGRSLLGIALGDSVRLRRQRDDEIALMAGEHFASESASNGAPVIRRCLCGRRNHHPANSAVRPVVAHVRQGHRVDPARPAMSHQLGDRHRVESGALCRFADRVPQHRGHRQAGPGLAVVGADQVQRERVEHCGVRVILTPPLTTPIGTIRCPATSGNAARASMARAASGIPARRSTQASTRSAV